MKKWFIKVSTDRVGTDSCSIIEEEDEKGANDAAWELGLDNYNQYDFAETDEKDAKEDGFDFIEGEHIETYVEEYNPEKHNDELFADEPLYEEVKRKDAIQEAKE